MLRHQSPTRSPTLSMTPLSQPALTGNCASGGNATEMIPSAQPGFAAKPVSNSIQPSSRPSGKPALHEVVPRFAIKRDQTASEPDEPVSPVGALSSYPIHTTARWLPENPANQLSR